MFDINKSKLQHASFDFVVISSAVFPKKSTEAIFGVSGAISQITISCGYHSIFNKCMYIWNT